MLEMEQNVKIVKMDISVQDLITHTIPAVLDQKKEKKMKMEIKFA